MENDYRLITAGSFGTLTASNFSFDSSGLSEDYTYALELSGNTLYLRVKALGEALNWNGGNAGIWMAAGGSAVWLDKDGDGQSFMTPPNPAILKIWLAYPPLPSP